jgi:DNA-binding PucR family transcriptional regulator
VLPVVGGVLRERVTAVFAEAGLRELQAAGVGRAVRVDLPAGQPSEAVADSLAPVLSDELARKPELLDTLVAYLDCGRSLEATSKQLFVHANTVRYRLKRISEIIGWDATGAHEAFVLQVAMVLGSMSESNTEGTVS